MKWIPENSRERSFMFLCSSCGKKVYAKPQGAPKYGGVKKCDYKYCPYCGEKAEENYTKNIY